MCIRDSLSTDLINVANWEVVELSLLQNLYKKAAFVVAARESCVACIKMRSIVDGTFKLVQRSIDVPFIQPPAGYVRAMVECGGYDLSSSQSSEQQTSMFHLNCFDPQGSVPSSIVKRTIPERCLIISRIRKALR